MADRKVLIKYYPPDFDYRRLEKVERLKDKQDNVRMMLPMSVRCLTCGNFMYIGTKFNMRKETVLDQDYLGIKIFRFYFKCTRCSAEISMKTDPKNHDYVCEHGASRNYEPWRDMANAEQVLRMRRNLDDGDAMKSLENRTFDSKKEMELIEALDQVRLLNKRQAKISPDELLEQYAPKKDPNLNEEGLTKEEVEQLRVFKIKKLTTLEKDEEEDKQEVDEKEPNPSKTEKNVSEKNERIGSQSQEQSSDEDEGYVDLLQILDKKKKPEEKKIAGGLKLKKKGG